MATLSGVELDPLFLKALTLLRSNRPESTKELGELVQEYREKNYGSTLLKKDGNGRKSPHPDARVNKPPKVLKNVKVNESPNSLTLLEKLEEITNSNDDSSNQSTKSTTLEESIEEITVGSSLESKGKNMRHITVDETVSMSSLDTKGISAVIDLNDSISIDDIIEMDFDGPMCKLCHLNKRGNEEENALVECSDCHSHYHQKCHRPEVSTKDLNDPRLIWYCSKCTKRMRKEMAAQQSTNTSKSSGVEVTPAPKLLNPFQQTKPFRRNHPVAASNSSIATNETLVPSTENVARDGSLSPMSNKRPRDVTANSMKRLELFKKKLKQARK
ncbi:integrator complex subunit 12-like [Hydractinia symbiolongicarpus]|uniref:integrator complex subunit 12-like n=1 Tax=Hydractinia symbiolongicarpus TaxID=13093 RepID=UPI002549CE92|nr:integrator complex subunit 12-like [Hydractinia symbiolongicarpus]